MCHRNPTLQWGHQTALLCNDDHDDNDDDDEVVGNPVIPWQELIQSDGRLILAGGGQARSAHVDDDEEDDVTMVICICIYIERVPYIQTLLCLL